VAVERAARARLTDDLELGRRPGHERVAVHRGRRERRHVDGALDLLREHPPERGGERHLLGRQRRDRRGRFEGAPARLVDLDQLSHRPNLRAALKKPSE
jgi:hypothetical protein